MIMTNPAFSRRGVLVLMGMAALALAGCGRKAEPKPPPDADPKSPRVYPVDRTRPTEEPPELPPEQQSPFLTPPNPMGPLPSPTIYR